MKIQLIHLEEHDDIISACDKMGWGQTGRVVLVWPERRKGSASENQASSEKPQGRTIPLTTRLDLVRLQRRANELGVQLAFVTHHANIRAHAHSLGIPIFKTPREAQNIHWRRSRRHRFAWQRRSPSQRRINFWKQIADSPHQHPLATRKQIPILARAFIFIIAVIAVLGLIVALLPDAEITLTPATKVQSVTFPVSASKEIKDISLSGELPTYPVTTIVEGQSAITTTANTMVPYEYATGYVRFTNLTTEQITIPMGTIVTAPLTDTIRFATTREGVIPKGPNSSIFIVVKASSPGSTANLAVGSIRRIEGALNYQLAVTNTAPTRGGTERSVPSPSPEDRIKLYNQLVTILRQNALTDLELQLKPGDILLSSTMNLEDQPLKIYEPDQSVPATHLHLTIRLEYSAEKIAWADLYELGSTILDANLPEGYQPVLDSVEITVNSQPQLDRNQVAHCEITAEQKIKALLSKDEAVSLALGAPPEEAMQRLTRSLSIVRPPEITIQPAWWPRLPFIPLRIRVNTDGE